MKVYIVGVFSTIVNASYPFLKVDKKQREKRKAKSFYSGHETPVNGDKWHYGNFGRVLLKVKKISS